ncbi:AraC family transcriptional regulator [Tritonibacter horizontis]|uniref:Arabinose operon regulatory protein n=1 Tax=Tritonibacter horizontis TaxID=1768241 RepID=A0A132C1N9_9RHOB|nr:AraC family transcriptional regulator [Tritonibacter horizontis]KUP94555.1 arabinose operon regulatory protein [Tritonibacter horizontis]
MSYHHQFTGETQGIRATAPVKWRQLDGVLGAFWEAEGDVGGQGYYVSANPRISIFFNDVSSIRMANADRVAARKGRPLARAIYVPAGTPMWTRFTDRLQFSHLDVHLQNERLVKFLSPAIGRAAACAVAQRPTEITQTEDLQILAGLLVRELERPSRHSHYAESLVGSLVAGVLDMDDLRPNRSDGRLTDAQMRKLVHYVQANADHRLSVAEMADTVKLSESWFHHAFKCTTGTTPMQWQTRQRVALAQRLLTETEMSLADVANRLGFADQAHLSKVFRRVVGQTPAQWRRTPVLR